MMTSMDEFSNGVYRLHADGGGFAKLHGSNPFCSISSLDNLRLAQHGSHAPPRPPPRYSSLQLLPPPLLPLPLPSMSKHGKKMSNAAHGKRDQKKRRRPTAGSKREPPTSVAAGSGADADDDVSQPNNAAKNKEKEIITREEKAVISPPPSSLPLPSLALIRLRTAVASRGDGCGGGGGGAMLPAGGATDELRRLLRL